MTVTIISDCKDNNAVGRQITRASSLFGAPATFVGVSSDIEAAGCLIDMLDAFGDEEGVLLVNVAPRNGAAKKWPNGTPFGYFKYKNILVVSSIDGHALSLVKKFGLTEKIEVLDIPTVLDAAVADGRMASDVRDHVVKGQFRSFDFVPRAAHYLKTGFRVPSETLSIAEIIDIPEGTVWWVDNFGNCKTTSVSQEKNYVVGSMINTQLGDFSYYARLKDVPDDEIAVIEGSSGMQGKRFIEIVKQGSSAAAQLNVASGQQVL